MMAASQRRRQLASGRLASVLERHSAHDEREQDEQQRQVEAAEQRRVPLGEGGEGRAAGGEEPDLVAVPHRADGGDQDASLGLVVREDRKQHADTEVEPLENEVADPQHGDQAEPHGGELHETLLAAQ